MTSASSQILQAMVQRHPARSTGGIVRALFSGVEAMKAKLPPYGKPLAERKKYGNPPLHAVVCVGADCWLKVGRSR